MNKLNRVRFAVVKHISTILAVRGLENFPKLFVKKCRCRTDRLWGEKAIEAWNRRADNG